MKKQINTSVHKRIQSKSIVNCRNFNSRREKSEIVLMFPPSYHIAEMKSFLFFHFPFIFTIQWKLLKLVYYVSLNTFFEMKMNSLEACWRGWGSGNNILICLVYTQDERNKEKEENLRRTHKRSGKCCAFIIFISVWTKLRIMLCLKLCFKFLYYDITMKRFMIVKCMRA